MNELTREWIEKAEGDWRTSARELRARRHPNYDAVCFHAQQAAEKYLKAFLQENGTFFPKTHHLIDLLQRCVSVDPGFEFLRDLLILLDRYAVRYRYPGETADREEARRAFHAATRVRSFVRQRLGLSEDPSSGGG
jgi:HEPN domain-containing protein